MPKTVSKSEIATKPMISTSSVLDARCTSTLSMTTWKNSGETRPSSCRNSNPSSGSRRRCRYLWIAPRNQVMSNRRVMSDNAARRVIRISRPSQTARSSLRVIKVGRGSSGHCTSTLSSAALATNRNPPSRRIAIAGNGVRASRDQSVRQARALSPNSLAHRSISGTPIWSVRSRCRICPASAATPWKCRSVTRASSRGSASLALSITVVTCSLRGYVASGVRLREQRRLACLLIDNRHRAGAAARRGETRGHELAQQRESRRRVKDDVAAGSAVEDVLATVADQDVVSCPAGQRVIAGATDQDIVAVAAVGGELHAGQPGRIDDVVAAEAIDDNFVGSVQVVVRH